MRGLVKRGRDVHSPTDVRAVRGNESDGKEAKRESRRVENMSETALALPLNEFLAQDAGGDEKELQIKPIVLEPQKQIGAHDDGDRSETEHPLIAARPAHQHVQRIGEDNLRGDQRHIVVNLAPVPSPIQVNRGVHHELHIVHRPGDKLVG